MVRFRSRFQVDACQRSPAPGLTPENVAARLFECIALTLGSRLHLLTHPKMHEERHQKVRPIGAWLEQGLHVHVVFSTIPISPMQNTDTFKWFLFTTFWLQLSSTQSHLPLCDMDNNLGLAFRQIAAERANQ